MALDSASTWAANIVQAIQSVGVQAGTEVTQAQLEQVWEAVKEEDTTQLGKSEVAPGTFAAGGDSVTGVGGPVS